MLSSPHKPPHVLFLFSDTGGGHRSAAEAIIEALSRQYGERISTEMVDIFKDYAPHPFNRLPEYYPYMVRVPQAWKLGYRLSDGRRRTRAIIASAWLYVGRRVRKLVTQKPSNMIVSVHPIAIAPVLRALWSNHPPFFTVVTDMVTTHAFWYHREVDLSVVPTEMARQRALSFGIKPERIRVIGLPVAERFCHPPGDKSALRARLGWPVDALVILLVGGGEGMGPLEKVARTIAAADANHGHLHAALVIVAGRNQQLRARLEASFWPIPTFIYGFVREMPDFMRAADILVTKAGPGTISEAFNAALPMILYDRLPGQEDGNVTYVTSQGAGVWAPQAERIVATLQDWIQHPERRSRAAEACRRLARPDAASQIADLLAARLGVELKKSDSPYG